MKSDLEILLSWTMTKLYNKNTDEGYRQALKDLSFEVCKYLELRGTSLNKTELTTEWLESEDRIELRRTGLIK
jgi:hypothetical protein